MRLEAVEGYKRQLRRAIVDLITYRGYSAVDAGKLAGMSGSTIGGLVSGRTADGFSLDRLIAIAVSLGLKVEMNVQRKWQRTHTDD